MTKADLIGIVATANHLSKGHAKLLVDRVFECIKDALGREERVEIRALGSFEIRHYGSYKGRDPRTGAAVAVKPKRLPFFRANYKLKELLNPSVTRTQDLPAVPEDRQRGQPRAGLRTA
jgi:integration host factor subunit beta